MMILVSLICLIKLKKKKENGGFCKTVELFKFTSNLSPPLNPRTFSELIISVFMTVLCLTQNQFNLFYIPYIDANKKKSRFSFFYTK